MPAACVEHSSLARLVLDGSIGAFAVGELLLTLRVRRGASRVDLLPEIAARAMLLGGILLLPIGRAVVPAASIGGRDWVFGLGVVIGWVGLLVRWWSFVTLGRYFTVVVRTSADQPIVERALTAALGDRCRDFASGRARLFPHVW